MIRWIAIALLAASILPGRFATAAEADSVEVLTASDQHKPIRTDIGEFAWYSGHWLGAALGGNVEEVWLQPAAGTMAGIFRLVKDGRVVFYELMTLGESNGYTAMRLKHFHANVEGWEERTEVVEFPLLKVDGTRFYFNGVTLVRENDGAQIHVRIENRKTGQSRIEVFRYRRGASLQPLT